MLVLARRLDERIVLRDVAGKLIGEIKITDLDRGKVRLGFIGFEGIQIAREEVDVPRVPAGVDLWKEAERK